MWQPILLAISSNLDDLSVSFSFGLGEKRLPLAGKPVIAIISGITMAAGLILGENIAHFIPEGIEVYIGAAVFAAFGLWFIIKEKLKERKESSDAFKIVNKEDFDKENHMSWKTIITLGLALGIDSITLGFSGGLAGYPVIFTAVFATITSFVFVWVGTHLGKRLSSVVGKYAYYTAGIFLLIIAITELIF